MAETCGVLSQSELTAWELQSVARQNEVIQARLEKEARRKQRQQNAEGADTTPAVKNPTQSE
ncbi:MAG: hypothetical protein Cons2KO_00330 [Congregibacter sp.]